MPPKFQSLPSRMAGDVPLRHCATGHGFDDPLGKWGETGNRARMANLLDGRALARIMEDQIRAEIGAGAQNPFHPGLAVILVGQDEASAVYVGQKIKACARVGIASFEHRLDAQTPEAKLLALIATLNKDPAVHGILCQVPLPPQIDPRKVIDAIDPTKDVDGFHPVNVGRLAVGDPGLTPCTPTGITRLLETQFDSFAGLDALVIGRSNIVGKPAALMLIERGATVTVANSRTQELEARALAADIVIAAVGVPELVRGSWIKPGAVVIDVGISRVARGDGTMRLVGDVAIAEMDHARAVTPVPGGVGPMTIACLLANTVKAARMNEAPSLPST